MRDVVEVSYTGDLLSHRRCARAWAYEKQAGFKPYEQVQAMEGRLIHHAMEWLTRFYSEQDRHADRAECQKQIEHYFRVLWSRGIRTRFEKKVDTIDGVLKNLFPDGVMHPTVKAAIEGAQHTEYEIRSVRKLVPARNGGKSKLLLTGVLDLVVQQQQPLIYSKTLVWTDPDRPEGKPETLSSKASPGDIEIWDYKGTKAGTEYLKDYVRQLLTYAAIYRDRTGSLPTRCVLFFVNEGMSDEHLLAIPINESVVHAALRWTHEQVENLQATLGQFQKDPMSVSGGEYELRDQAPGQRMATELKQQCTACGQRFDCPEYKAHLQSAKGRKHRAPGEVHPDVDLLNVRKN